MNKTEKVIAPLSELQRAVVFDADLTNEDDQAFKVRLEATAALQLKNLQELIIALIKGEENSQSQKR